VRSLPHAFAAVVLAVSGLVAGCQLDRAGTGLDLGDAAIADAAGDAAPDAAADAVGPDASPDVVSDAPADVATDAPADGPVDVAADSPVDVAVDVPVDGPPDAPVDAPLDAPLDAPVDAPVDAPLDALDAAEDSPVDGPLDAVEEPDAPVVSAGFALSFSNGDDTYVEVGNVQVPLDFTIEAWVRPASTPGETYILAKDREGQSANQFRFGITGQDYLFFLMSNAAGNDGGLWNGNYTLTSPAKVPMNTWTHVAVVKQSTTFRLLVNGAVVRSIDASADLVHAGAQPMRMAARVASDGSASGPFDGVIDEVRLFSTARTEAVIAAERGAPQTPASLWWPSLVAYWRFDEGAELTTQDERGNYPGTLVNGPVWVESGAF
jgi:hypothetical protein